MVTMNLKVNEYTSRVLGVVKEKYGLRDKAQALDRFTEMFGEDFVDREIREEVVREVMDIEERHFKKYGFKTTTMEELRKKIEGK